MKLKLFLSVINLILKVLFNVIQFSIGPNGLLANNFVILLATIYF